jgi:glycosyltransferase involved in cell wall biosynthesis
MCTSRPPASPTPATPRWPPPSGDLIAFLDDDEEASPGWLAALIETQRRYDADVVFGPVRARAPVLTPAPAISGTVLLPRRAGRERDPPPS